jgi:predicted nucleotidyltransferase
MSIVDIPTSKIENFCRRWKIIELALFGSILREDFGPDSDVDVLVTFAEDSDLSLYDLVDMQEELRLIFGRDVDLVLKSGLRNPFRRHEILRTQRVIYAA